MRRSLPRNCTSANAVPLSVTICSGSATEQIGRLRAAPKQQEAAHPAACCAEGYPSWGLVTLPPMLGKYRVSAREALRRDASLRAQLCPILLDAPAATQLHAVIVGCRSLHYIERQLQHAVSTHCVVMDHDLSRLVACAFALRPKYGHQVAFLRCDPAVAFWARLFGNETLDVVAMAMPVPHASKQASHRRLLTRDLFHVVHPTLRVRSAPSDAKGVVAFTDALAYAEFAAGQLEESKLIVPWARKRADVFERWVPRPDDLFPVVGKSNALSGRGNAHLALHTLAASKSAPTTAHALQALEHLDFRRQYFDAFVPDNSNVADAGDSTSGHSDAAERTAVPS